jgi:hypothetical protein
MTSSTYAKTADAILAGNLPQMGGGYYYSHDRLVASLVLPLHKAYFNLPRDQLRLGVFLHKREKPGNEVDKSELPSDDVWIIFLYVLF